MIQFLQGNCIDKIKELEDNSIDCVVSSPPYFGLRDYGTAQWQGGDPNCDHIANPNATKKQGNPEFNKDRPSREETKYKGYHKDICPKCGAKRIDEQFGLEKTYQEYIANTVKVFETFKPKLKDTATIWWNVGDSYASFRPMGTSDNGQYDGIVSKAYSGHLKLNDIGRSGKTSKVPGNHYRGRGKISGCLKPKDLVMIPNRVAIALQEAGWYIRSEIIWHKPNPMPESVRDRPTSCHEKIWLITKSKKYYYDADAIKEPTTESTKQRYKSGWKGNEKRDYVSGKQNHFSKYIGTEKSKQDALKGRNKRNVWTVTPKPFKDAHFATFPKDLIEPCIKAGCPENGIVLDPFGGAGTTGIVAKSLNRRSILIELNPEYIKIAKKRVENEFGLFNEILLTS